MTSTGANEAGQGLYTPRRIPHAERVQVGEVGYRVWHWAAPGGHPVVLLHGWMDSGATFQFAVDHLPPDWDIIAPDWRGFGDSERAPENYYFPDYLADLDALLDAYFPDRPVLLVGHSMGGNVAGLYAGVRPARVERLISLEGFGLASAAPEVAPERYTAWLDSLREVPGLRAFDDYDALAAHLQRQNPRLTAERADYVARCWGESAADGTTVRLRGDARHKRPNPVLYRLDEAMACWRRVTAPTLWLMADESGVLRRSGAESDFEARLACFRDIRTRMIERSGHSIHLDQPVRLAESMVLFANG